MNIFEYIENSTYKKIIIGIGILFLGLLILVGYRVIYMASISDYIKEFIAGCMGAVLTIFATAALLKSQSEHEVVKEQLTNIFIKKLELYNSFIDFLNSAYKDRKVTYSEIDEMIEWATKISLICRASVTRSIYHFIMQTMMFGHYDTFDDMPKKIKKEWKEWMISEFDEEIADHFHDDNYCYVMYPNKANIITMLRSDLWNKNTDDFDENLDMQSQLTSILELRNKNSLNDEDYLVKR